LKVVLASLHDNSETARHMSAKLCMQIHVVPL